MIEDIKSFSDFLYSALLIDLNAFKSKHEDRSHLFNPQSNFSLDPLVYKFDFLFDLFCRIDPDPNHLRIIKNQTAYTNRLPKQYHLRRLLFEDLYSEGYSFILTSIHLYSSYFSGAAFRLSNISYCNVDLNLYLTPPNSTALAPHYDTHDVFSFQLFGFKRWFLYVHFLKPLVGSFQPRISPGNWNDLVDACSQSCLFIPRGLVHSATSLDHPSVHLTVSFHRQQKLDMLNAKLRYFAECCDRRFNLSDYHDFDSTTFSLDDLSIDLASAASDDSSGLMLNLNPPFHKNYHVPNIELPSQLSTLSRSSSTRSQFKVRIAPVHYMIKVHENQSSYIIFDFHSRVIFPKALRHNFPEQFDTIILFLQSKSLHSQPYVILDINLSLDKILWKFLRRLCYSSLIHLCHE